MESTFLVRNGGSILSLVHMAIGFIIILIGSFSFLAQAYGERKVHIVYLGERQHDDPEFVKASHHQMLESLLGSKEEARKSMVYNYQHGFSGFAATLTDSEVKKISEHPDVIHVIPNRIHKLHTTRTWDYLGLSQGLSDGLLHKTSMGVWPESESYNDKGFGPIPKRWRGECVSGEEFNATVHCNKKLIGAKYYAKGLLNQVGHLDDTSKFFEFMSPRDADGHGTHTSSTAGGSFVPNVSYNGLARGTVRGGAPRARIAIYKACWHLIKCATADVWKAFDDAIHDGVDVLSASLGIEVPLFIEVDKSAYDIVSFHAVMRGIPVISSAGNEGPSAQTVSNVAPWVVTVAATTLDRSLFTSITLGNNLTLMGEAIHTGPDIDFTGIIFPRDSPDDADVNVKGKIVLVFDTSVKNLSALASIRQGGGSGLIYARPPGDVIEQCTHDFPCIFIDYEIATKILVYIRSTRSPTVRISRTKTLNGPPAATKVAGFSNRGPNSLSPAILKPDIAAPGVNILAAMSPQHTATDGGYAFLSGTSMATPIIAGIVTLLKVLHPHWSPAAIRSAMVTTAWRTDPSGEPIFAEGLPKKLADPFDYGGGLVNPEKAAQPGLVYDMGLDDYVMYLCSAGYSDSSISQLVGKATRCLTPKPSVLDVNLPSIKIPDLKDKVTLTRTVTNVGPVNSVYKAIVEPPLGIKIIVKPRTLVFNSATKKVTFSVTVSTAHKVNTGYYFGSLTWTNGVHIVSIPLSVRTQILKYYN